MHHNRYRIMLRLVCAFVAWVSFRAATGQDHNDRYRTIDVLKYTFDIALTDTSDLITAEATLDIRFREATPHFSLDLAGPGKNGKGMVIREITGNGFPVPYRHDRSTILIESPDTESGTTRNYRISYSGIPGDGLIISENKYGNRTFFGDNWPDRAHHWLPVVDHPSDKALVEFRVCAPCHYGIVSNGSLSERIREASGCCSRWVTREPLATKLMVIGVSPFAVQYLESKNGISVSSWVYPENREEGFHDYGVAVGALDLFESYIGPYPYSKLANVQSTTRYGGMENAGCIFYHENSVTGNRDYEKTIAHEVAHQWFGNAVTEQNWHHIWLSEGFATYLADIYLEQTRGREAFIESVKQERDEVIAYSRRQMAPVVDTTLPVSVRLLNRNSYEKGAWVLHMLRRELGEVNFRKCLRAYYTRFKHGNALTDDFRSVADSVSGRDLRWFFEQWIYAPGHPVLAQEWDLNESGFILRISQKQATSLCRFPLDVKIVEQSGNVVQETLDIKDRSEEFRFDSIDRPPKRIILDPGTWLLFEQAHSP